MLYPWLFLLHSKKYSRTFVLSLGASGARICLPAGLRKCLAETGTVRHSWLDRHRLLQRPPKLSPPSFLFRHQTKPSWVATGILDTVRWSVNNPHAGVLLQEASPTVARGGDTAQEAVAWVLGRRVILLAGPSACLACQGRDCPVLHHPCPGHATSLLSLRRGLFTGPSGCGNRHQCKMTSASILFCF